MSGHNKWSKIKRQKGLDDAKRGQLFTKLTRGIILAVREGGSGDSSTNFKLRLAIQKAHDSSMPLDNIERAIKKASGEGAGSLEEMTLEGYGPGGVAILVQALSDNHKRTVQDIRSTFARHGGNLGESGSVAWLFESKGLISIDAKGIDTDELTLSAIDAGAEDVMIDGSFVEIYTKPEKLETVKGVLEPRKLPSINAEVSLMPKTSVELDEKAAVQTLKLLDKLEELDDVQLVVSNADFSDAVLEKYRSGVLV